MLNIKNVTTFQEKKYENYPLKNMVLRSGLLADTLTEQAKQRNPQVSTHGVSTLLPGTAHRISGNFLAQTEKAFKGQR